MENCVISGYACVSKKLQVARFTGENPHNLLILESDPEQGYFFTGNLPGEMGNASDHHLYFVVRKTIPCFQDRILRYAHKLKNEQQVQLHLLPGQMTFENEIHSCIRVRVSEVALLSSMVENLEEMGVEFFCQRHFKHFKPYASFIRFKKYIQIEEFEEDVFRDHNNKNIHYVKIPADIEFSLFETMIKDIKNNCELNMFSTSLVYFPLKDDIFDMVAIYSRECDEQRLPQLSEFLDKEIKRIFK